MKNQFIRNQCQLFVFILMLLVMVSFFNVESQAAAYRPRPVSTGTGGSFGNGVSRDPQISADGRYVVFSSSSSNLIPGLSDTNSTEDVFIRDLQNGTLQCLSVALGGTSTGNDSSFGASISADGRYVVFTGNASNLVTGDTNNSRDIFRYDMQTNSLTIVSLNGAGTAPANGNSNSPEISNDARFVIFLSSASDIVPGFVDGNGGLQDIYVRDMQTNTTKLITINAAGTASGNGGVGVRIHAFRIDDSGRFVTFVYEGSNLVAGVSDTNTLEDVFVRDLQTNTTTCVSVNPAGNATGNAGSDSAQISADGKFVFFQSNASNLIQNDNNSASDVFYRDLTTGTTHLVSVNSAGTGSGNGASSGGSFIGPVSITPDGHSVVFTSSATDLVTGYTFTPPLSNVFVRNIQTGITRLVSVSSTGISAGNGSSSALIFNAISRDGRYVTFNSTANNLVSEDTNNFSDIYVRDMITNTTSLLSLNETSTNGGNNTSQSPIIASDARRVFFMSAASDLAPGDSNLNPDVFYTDFGVSQKAVSDFDGDGRTDFSVYRPSSGDWYVLPGTTGLVNIRQWGISTDRIVPADYDGDGKTDHAVFRASEGNWYIQHSVGIFAETINFGLPGDIPAPADFDGDGKADIAVFRPSNGTWYIRQSSNSQVRFQNFGLNGDIPVVGDYEGDGRADVAVFRPSERVWYILLSADSSFVSLQFGLSTDKPVPADYDGDGLSDIAVFRPSDGNWHIRGSHNGYYIQHWGQSGDIPAPGTFDGDGKADIAVFRPSTGDWYVLRSSNNSLLGVHWGMQGDLPTPSAYHQ